jgi:hypothetical protein
VFILLLGVFGGDNMPVFEQYKAGFIYTDEHGGAMFLHGEWFPFRYFDDGEIDVLSKTGCETYQDAYDEYKRIYT